MKVGMSKHSAAKRRARKEKCPGFLAEHVQPDPSQLSRQLGASSQAVLHLPTGAGASLGHSGARGHTTQCFNLWGYGGDRWGLLFPGLWSQYGRKFAATVTL